jgi:hypothetical protein
MILKIEAALRIQAGENSWFESLSKEQQKEYIELHPNSKFAKNSKSMDKPDKPENAGMKLKQRYKVTKDFVDTLQKLFKLKPNLRCESSPGWRKVQNGDTKKQSAYGYWKTPEIWMSETKDEWEAGVKKDKNFVAEDDKGRIVRH